MQSAQATNSIGANASLTDGGEPVVLFYYRGGPLVSDVDYVFYGVPTVSNPVVDKTSIVMGDEAYSADTAATAQHAVPLPSDGASVHRCRYDEFNETQASGNGLTGHDETSEDARASFALGTAATERTPGGPPPPGVCKP
jgi:hypothetical protein